MRTGNFRWTITVETERVVVLRRYRGISQSWCIRCGELVDTWADAEAEALAHWSAGAVERRLVEGTLHRIATDTGLRLCGKALYALVAQQGPFNVDPEMT